LNFFPAGYLGEETIGNCWARGLDCTADGHIYPTLIFPEAQWCLVQNVAARCVEQEHAS